MNLIAKPKTAFAMNLALVWTNCMIALSILAPNGKKKKAD